MLNHLDDPTGSDLPTDLCDRVARRARTLRVRRRLATGGLAAILAISFAAGGLYARSMDHIDDVERLTVAGTRDPGEGEDRTIVVVGTDARPDDVEQHGPGRTDTILAVRISDGRASVLSIPRDLAVSVPSGGEQLVRINTIAAEHGYGGLLGVIGEELGIEAHNLVAIDMDGFASLVDLLGGVDVAFAEPVRDGMSGFDVGAGCHRLGGSKALALVRSRQIQTFDGARWRADPTGDLGRIARQPVLLAAGLEALTRVRPDPLTADRLAGWLSEHTSVDDTLGNRDLVSLARTLMALDPSDVTTTTPLLSQRTLSNGAAVLQLAEPATETVARWERGTSMEGAAGSGSVDSVIGRC